MRRLILPAAVAGAAAVLGLSSLFLPTYWLGVLALVTTFTIASLAQNVLAGYAAVPSLGNVAFFGVSAYTAAALITDARVPVGLALCAGIVAAGLLGFAVGLPALRVSGMHLAIVTVALVFVGQELMGQWNQSHNPGGLSVDRPSWLLEDRGLYLAAIVVAAVCYLAAHNLLRSRTGRAIVALSENPYAAAAVGIGVTRYRLAAFVVSGVLTGAGGVLYLYYQHTLTPGAFPLDLSLAFLTMIIVGGTRSLGGSILGALIIGLLPEFLRLFPSQIGPVNVPQSLSGLYALLLLLTLNFFPDGIWNAVVARVGAWQHEGDASASEA